MQNCLSSSLGDSYVRIRMRYIIAIFSFGGGCGVLRFHWNRFLGGMLGVGEGAMVDRFAVEDGLVRRGRCRLLCTGEPLFSCLGVLDCGGGSGIGDAGTLYIGKIDCCEDEGVNLAVFRNGLGLCDVDPLA